MLQHLLLLDQNLMSKYGSRAFYSWEEVRSTNVLGKKSGFPFLKYERQAVYRLSLSQMASSLMDTQDAFNRLKGSKEKIRHIRSINSVPCVNSKDVLDSVFINHMSSRQAVKPSCSMCCFLSFIFFHIISR